jgi:hypothetical protein
MLQIEAPFCSYRSSILGFPLVVLLTSLFLIVLPLVMPMAAVRAVITAQTAIVATVATTLATSTV